MPFVKEFRLKTVSDRGCRFLSTSCNPALNFYIVLPLCTTPMEQPGMPVMSRIFLIRGSRCRSRLSTEPASGLSDGEQSMSVVSSFIVTKHSPTV